MKGVRFIGAAATAMLLACSGIQVGAAPDANFAEGQKLLAARNYGGAVAKFEAAMKANPGNPNVAYYCALANQYANQRTRAKQLYEYISSSFPGSPVAAMASKALGALGSVATPTSSGATGGSGSVVSHSGGSSNVILPQHSFSVPYDHSGGAGVYLMGAINGQPIKFHFDTGAGGTVVGRNHLEEIGFARANNSGAEGKASGVGDEGLMKTWRQNVVLKIGEAQIRDFPLTVMDHMDGQPLLGQDFLRAFEYEVDPTKNVVTFKVRGEGGGHTSTASRPQRRGTIDIPFRDQGGHIVVQVRVNGKPYEFYFDTGADSVALAMKDLKPLGLEIPADAREGTSQGIAGSTRTWIFTVDSVKLGTIEKTNQQISVVENSKMDHPLLGQAFFGDYQTKIDADAHVIHFYKGD